jgi:hypothetical protein
MRRFSSFLLACALAFATLHGGACKGTAPPPDLTGVVFQGSADGPALDALLEAAAQPSTENAPIIDFPPDGTILQASPVPRFAWHLPGTMAVRPAPLQLLPAPPSPRSPAWLRDLLGPERAAHAGEEALTGVGYFLRFGDANTSQLFRVFTTETTYTPDASAWATISSAGIWTMLTVEAANFAGDEITPGGGPFVGTSVLFCVMRQP